MPDSTSSSPGHVVHLLQHWGDAVPPSDLRVRPSLGPTARAVIALVLTAEAVLAAYLIAVLWTSETPGWWFPLIFTVMIGGLTLGLWGGFVGAVQSGADRDRAAAKWLDVVAAVRPLPGVVVARDVGTREDGSVPRFALTVRTANGGTVRGVWQPRSSSRSWLQSQVPGVGADARVWRTDQGTDSDPLVIEVLDPSVATGAGGLGTDKYAD